MLHAETDVNRKTIRTVGPDEKMFETVQRVGAMRIVRIDDPGSVSFPFGREVFDDRQTLYHGTGVPTARRLKP